MSLEDHIRELARTGQFKRLQVVQTPQGYQAAFNIEGKSYRVDIRDDPVDAILVAIGAVHTLEMNRNSVKADAADEDVFG